MTRRLLSSLIALLVICGALVILKAVRDRSGYTLTSYQKHADTETISLRHEGHTIQAECSGYCDEFGTRVGQRIFCFTEPAPSDSSRPYATKRPVFKDLGGSFVCRVDGGTGRIFLVRKYKCFPEARVDDSERQLRNEYPGDALYVPPTELDKRYCKPGETLIDQGGDFVTEEGQVLPVADHTLVELKVIEMR